MKNLKSILVVFVLFLGMNAFAGTEKATIKTSAQCEMCEAKLETNLLELPGVLKVNVDVATKELMVKYNDELISLDDIKTAISNTGYWADDKAPNKEAYAALDACCKPKAKSCCAAKTACSKDGATKAAASSDAKACGDGCAKPCCADASKK